MEELRNEARFWKNQQTRAKSEMDEALAMAEKRIKDMERQLLEERLQRHSREDHLSVPRINLISPDDGVMNRTTGAIAKQNNGTQPAASLNTSFHPTNPGNMKQDPPNGVDSRDMGNVTQNYPSYYPKVTNNEQFHPGFDGFNSPSTPGSYGVDPTRHQQFMPHYRSYKLNDFHGDPQQWPEWINQYHATSAAGRFTDLDNSIRLRESLKGVALMMVKGMLMLPSNVNRALARLEENFGQPHFVIGDVLKQLEDAPSPRDDRPESIVAFSALVDNAVAVVEGMGRVERLADPTLLAHLVKKLPPMQKMSWGAHAYYGSTLKEFGMWLQGTANAAIRIMDRPVTSMALGIKHQEYSSRRQWNEVRERKSAGVHVHSRCLNESPERQIIRRCRCCDINGHSLDECKQFKLLTVKERWTLLRDVKNGTRPVCYACLEPGHTANNCTIQSSCPERGCSYNHHKLLHTNQQKKPFQSKYNSNSRSSEPHFHTTTCETDVLFKITAVRLFADNGKSVEVLAFIDEGSSVTLMNDSVRKCLGVEGTPAPLCLSWTGDTTRKEEQSRRLTLSIQGIGPKCKRFNLPDVRTVKNLDLPAQSLSMSDLRQQYPHLAKVPCVNYNDEQPQILIGLIHHRLGLATDTIEGPTWNSPAAVETRLGWIICGPIQYKNRTRTTNRVFVHRTVREVCGCDMDESMNEQLRHYMTTEAFGTTLSTRSLESKDDQRAREIVEGTTRRVCGKRFETGLLWKECDINLPNSFNMALKRLNCTENRMMKDSNYARLYKEKIKEYVDKGYVRKLSMKEVEEAKGPRHWITPHSGIYNINKSPPKFRLIFDLAASVDGVSLNAMLLKGPDIYTTIVGVLYRGRQHAVVVIGDIEEMFLRVKVRQEDQSALCFLWRDGESNRTPDMYVITVLPFGSTCSPYLAQKVKNMNANEFEKTYPRAVAAIVHDHYVDDLFTSFKTEEEAIKVTKEIIHIHSEGGFKLRGFMSNSKKVTNELNGASTEAQKETTITFDKNDMDKVLGLWWRTQDDMITFKFKINKVAPEILSGDIRPTKRICLRIIMSIYDPLGLIAHYMAYAKVLLQYIWRVGTGWDESIDDVAWKKWQLWWNNLQSAEKIAIPRCYSTKIPIANSIQLHIFVDASDALFAAVGYLRVEDNEGNVDVALVGAKTRVAPQKLISIPRLELQAAVLGVRMSLSMLLEHNIHVNKVCYWSDSETVLGWLRCENVRKYKQFVAFRVSEVLDSTSVTDWNWIGTKDNVADDATKWIKVPDFDNNDRWFKGPNFLRLKEQHWPRRAKVAAPQTDDEELKAVHLHHRCTSVYDVLDVNNFSKWTLMVRATAWFWRAIVNWRCRKYGCSKNTEAYLSVRELMEAEKFIIQKAQWEAYGDEVTSLTKGSALPDGSSIKSLTPFWNDGMIHLLGRIERAMYIPESMKYPILMPRKHKITRLLVLYHHNNNYHMNNETVVSSVRRRWWIPQIRVAVRSAKAECQVCSNQKARPAPPAMAPLPEARVTPFTDAFTHTGVDAFGPYFTTIGRRKEKRYGIVYTCMTVRAIFIDLVNDMSTDSFIMSFRNFQLSRGLCCKHIYSDNGTNFRGADREMQASLRELDQSGIKNAIAHRGVEWHFNPPASPHMGGAWERKVRSIKRVLQKLLHNKTLRDDTLRNFLNEASHVVNSQPLTYAAIDNVQQEALTPYHFMNVSCHGIVPKILPPGIFTDKDLILGRQWRFVQQLANHFWSRWIKEYLPEITRRSKWHDVQQPLKVGDCVCIVDENAERNSWPKGIITTVRTGDRGQVRSATVTTADGSNYVRPATRLAKLDVHRYDANADGSNYVRPANQLAKLDVHRYPAKM